MDMEKVLEKLPPAPPGIDKWIRRELAGNTYIIYSKKEDKAACTRCGHTFRESRFNMRHGEKGMCPKCKNGGICLSSGIGRKKYAEYMRVLVFTHRGKTVYGTLTEIMLDYSPFGQPDIKGRLSAVYMFSENEQHYYRHIPGWAFAPGRWEEKSNIKIPSPPATGSFYSRPKFTRTETYKGNLKNVFEKSCLRYLHDEKLFKAYDFDAYGYIRYIHLGLKYRSLELLAKAGFRELVWDKVRDAYGSGCVNWRGKELKKILRLPMRDVRWIREYGPDFGELEAYQGLPEKSRRTSWGIVRKMCEVRRWGRMQRIEKYIGITKWVAWAAENDVHAYDWADYIGDCERAGLDLRRKKVLLPDNFHETHQQLAAEIEEKENAEKNERLRRIAETYALQVGHGTLTLDIAGSQQQLNRESAVLGHCVKTYGDRMACGDTVIFFIRKKADPDTPYYTLEIRPDGTFVQCRGKNNCGMTEEVEAFKDMAVAEFNKKIRKMKRSAA